MNKYGQRIVSVATVLAAVGTLAACASGFHYSQIDGYRYFKTSIDTYPVIISKVDGKSTPVGQSPVLVDPGVRMVEVQTYGSRTDRLGEDRTISLDVKPCTHYYLVAVKSNRVERDFDVKVEYQEPVPGCTPPPQ